MVRSGYIGNTRGQGHSDELTSGTLVTRRIVGQADVGGPGIGRGGGTRHSWGGSPACAGCRNGGYSGPLYSSHHHFLPRGTQMTGKEARERMHSVGAQSRACVVTVLPPLALSQAQR